MSARQFRRRAGKVRCQTDSVCHPVEQRHLSEDGNSILRPVHSYEVTKAAQPLDRLICQDRILINGESRGRDYESRGIPGMKEVSDQIQAYTYPLFHYDNDGRLALFASCVFLQVDESVYLVSAKHAPKGATSGLLTPGRSNFLEGIVIECHDDRYLFSTRVEHVLTFIRARVRPPVGQ